MANKDAPVEFGEEVAGRTIVGGRNRSSTPRTISVRVGVEKVLYLAATTPKFKERLLHARQETLADPALGLDEEEVSILREIPDEQLALMIERIDPASAKQGTRRFVRAVATCAAALGTSIVVGNGCGPSHCAGIHINLADAETELMDAGDIPPEVDGGSPDADTADVPVFPVTDAGGVRPDDGG